MKAKGRAKSRATRSAKQTKSLPVRGTKSRDEMVAAAPRAI